MNEQWRLAVSTGCCRRSPLPEVLRALADAGARRVEIGTPPEHFDPADAAAPLRVAGQVAGMPFDVVSMHAPFGPGFDLASEHWEHRDAGIRAALAAARALGAHAGAVLVVHPSDLARDGSSTGARLGRALEALLHIDRGCRELGVRLAVETPLPHLVGGHPDELQWLLERLPPAAGICLDTGHAHLGRFIDSFIAIAGARLTHVHLHDNRGTHDDHLIPGEGAIDWGACFDGLRRVQYAGALVLELSCDRPSADYFRKALDAARELGLRHVPPMLSAAPTA